MIYASKTSYFADFLALKRLILHFFEPQNVLFCIIHQVEEGGCAGWHPVSVFIPTAQFSIAQASFPNHNMTIR